MTDSTQTPTPDPSEALRPAMQDGVAALVARWVADGIDDGYYLTVCFTKEDGPMNCQIVTNLPADAIRFVFGVLARGSSEEVNPATFDPTAIILPPGVKGH